MVAGTSSGSVAASRQKAKTAFSKVQDVFTRMSKEHTKIQGDLKTLVPHVGQLTHTQLAEQKALAAAKQASQCTSFVQSDMELLMQTTEMCHAQATKIPEFAYNLSAEALLKAEGVKRE